MSELKTRTVHELKMEGDEGDVVVAFAKLDAVDEDEDYTFAGAFPEGKSLPMSGYGHTSWPERGSALPPGKGQIKEIGGWEVFEGKFFTDTTHGRDTYLTVRHMGPEQQWSYGYDVLATAPPPPGVKARRGLKHLDPHEVSPVLLGAQAEAHTRSIKERATADPEALDDLIAEQQQYLQELTNDSELKAALRAGETFDAHIGRLLSEVNAFERRAQGLIDLRLKEGRAISTARLEQFRTHADALLAAHKTFVAIIEAAQPKTESVTAKARRMRIEAQQGLAGLDFPTRGVN